jgi:hypothetical protein
MKKFESKGVVVATLIAFSSLGCASADVEKVGELQQRATVTTQPLPVSRVSYPNNYGNRLTFVLPQPFLGPLFLNSIVITRVDDTEVGSSITRGASSTQGGTVLIYVNAANFDALVSQRALPFKVIPSYDDVTLKMVQLELVRDAAHVTPTLVQRLVITLP